MSQPTVVIDASDPPVALTCGFAGLPRPAEVFALPSSGGLPLARLNLVGDPNSPDTVRRANYPLFAWVVRHNRLLVWSEGFLRWLRWPPPPPSPPPSRWRAFASAVTGVRPLPPDLDLLAEYPFPYLADAVAPLPDGDTVLVASKGAMIRWHAPTSTEQARWRWPGMQALRSLAVSPDGTVAAAGGNGGRVIVWDLDV